MFSQPKPDDLTRIDATVFGFSDQTAFSMDQMDARFLALSAISTAFGLFLDASLLFMYLGTDAPRFVVRMTPNIACVTHAQSTS